MSRCATVKIKSKDGYIIINESDFDDKKHTLFVEKKPPAKKPKARAK